MFIPENGKSYEKMTFKQSKKKMKENKRKEKINWTQRLIQITKVFTIVLINGNLLIVKFQQS